MRVKYFAYGSNMSLDRLRARAPSASFVGVYTLTGHDLRFHKIGQDGSAKCDAFFTRSADDVIEGVLFELHRKHVPFLDTAEGLGMGYRKKSVEVFESAGGRLEAFTYVATHIDDSLLPFGWYLNHVLVGARAAPLSRNYVARIKGTRCIEDPDRGREQRESALYSPLEHYDDTTQ